MKKYVSIMLSAVLVLSQTGFVIAEENEAVYDSQEMSEGVSDDAVYADEDAAVSCEPKVIEAEEAAPSEEAVPAAEDEVTEDADGDFVQEEVMDSVEAEIQETVSEAETEDAVSEEAEAAADVVESKEVKKASSVKIKSDASPENAARVNSGSSISNSGGSISNPGGGSVSNSGGSISNPGGSVSNSGGSISNSGGSISNSGGSISNSGGSISNSGGSVSDDDDQPGDDTPGSDDQPGDDTPGSDDQPNYNPGRPNHHHNGRPVQVVRITAEKQSVTKGDTVLLGAYDQDNNPENGKEEIEWTVLEVKDGKALAVSKYALDFKAYAADSANTSWENSDLRKWLNDTFVKEALMGEESHIAAAQTEDQVFILTVEQASKYFKNDEERICLPTESVKAAASMTENEGVMWWLNSTDASASAAVDQNGSIVSGDLALYSNAGAVRPALWINLNA